MNMFRCGLLYLKMMSRSCVRSVGDVRLILYNRKKRHLPFLSSMLIFFFSLSILQLCICLQLVRCSRPLTSRLSVELLQNAKQQQQQQQRGVVLNTVGPEHNDSTTPRKFITRYYNQCRICSSVQNVLGIMCCQDNPPKSL